MVGRMAEPSQSGHVRIAGAIAGVGSGQCSSHRLHSRRTLIIISPAGLSKVTQCPSVPAERVLTRRRSLLDMGASKQLGL